MRVNPYELYHKIEDLDKRLTDHISEEKAFWDEMNIMKTQIHSMFTAATWMVKITRVVFTWTVTLGTGGFIFYEWFTKHVIL